MTPETTELIKNLMYIPMGVAIIGTILNAQKKIICFPIWILSNIALVIMNLLIGVYAMVGLFIVYTAVSIYGWISWSKEASSTQTSQKNTDTVSTEKIPVASKIETAEIPVGFEIGTVKWYNRKKGFGFIIAEKDDREVFFHQTHIDMPGFRIVQESQLVCFTTAEGERGEEGRGVKPL